MDIGRIGDNCPDLGEIRKRPIKTGGKFVFVGRKKNDMGFLFSTKGGARLRRERKRDNTNAFWEKKVIATRRKSFKEAPQKGRRPRLNSYPRGKRKKKNPEALAFQREGKSEQERFREEKKKKREPRSASQEGEEKRGMQNVLRRR